MVQIRPNWADVTGRLVSVNPAAEGYAQAVLSIESADDVAAMPNLFRDRLGQNIKVQLPNDLITKHMLSPGDRIRARLRLGDAWTAFAHPDLCERLGE